jgi:DNA-binding NtrC family response regulator
LNYSLKKISLFPDFAPSFAPTNSSVAFWSPELNTASSSFRARPKTAPLIYAVDDMSCITELYALVLHAAGYEVRCFRDRHAALAGIEAKKPALLITDLHNPSMRIEPFLEQCIKAHPSLRILMATGFGYHRAWCFSVTPHQFLQKPFTPGELKRAVEATLAGETADHAR